MCRLEFEVNYYYCKSIIVFLIYKRDPCSPSSCIDDSNSFELLRARARAYQLAATVPKLAHQWTWVGVVPTIHPSTLPVVGCVQQGVAASARARVRSLGLGMRSQYVRTAFLSLSQIPIGVQLLWMCCVD